MILDSLTCAEQYFNLHPLFAQGFEFLRRSNLGTLPDGRHEISGDSLFAIVARNQSKTKEQARFEVHRRFIDIQFMLTGRESMGWAPLESHSHLLDPYDVERDVTFCSAPPAHWIDVAQGAFAIFFPSDLHAPGVTPTPVHKIVIKIAAEAGCP